MMDSTPERFYGANILIVDDTPVNLRLLNELLQQEGHQIRLFLRGALALEAAEKEPPDLILLDINMPEMNGYEICRRLKENEALRDIPIIFISALDETVDKIKAFNAGGVDYITKPFQAEEVHARVKTHLELRRLQKALCEQNQLLEIKVRERTAKYVESNERLKKEIEERIRLEKELIQSQKMEAIGRLASGVAHDFNNLLMVIEGCSGFALKNLPEDDPIYQDIDNIRNAGYRASSLTRQLLTFSRRQMTQPQIINVNSLINEMCKMLHRLIGENIELIETLDPSLRSIKADPGQIEQIVMNLAVNSRDAMPKGGRLTIETANVYLDEGNAFKYGDDRTGTHVMLAVGDTGCGMDPQIQEKIFEPFFTTKEYGKGTGLGLSTVYGIVTQNDGMITVASEPNRGSTFRIFLPNVGESAAPIQEDIDLDDPTKIKETILVVEDDRAARMVITRILREKGYTIVEASDGAEALQIYKMCEYPIHLLLTDVVMPGLSGRELYEQIRSFNSNAKVLFMSGYTEEDIVQHGVLENGVAFIQKPITPADILRKVRMVLDRE